MLSIFNDVRWRKTVLKSSCDRKTTYSSFIKKSSF
jgi:hypothetical protein